MGLQFLFYHALKIGLQLNHMIFSKEQQPNLTFDSSLMLLFQAYLKYEHSKSLLMFYRSTFTPVASKFIPINCFPCFAAKDMNPDSSAHPKKFQAITSRQFNKEKHLLLLFYPRHLWCVSEPKHISDTYRIPAIKQNCACEAQWKD